MHFINILDSIAEPFLKVCSNHIYNINIIIFSVNSELGLLKIPLSSRHIFLRK